MESMTSFLNMLVSGLGYFLSAAYNSFFFAVVKFLIGIYVIVLLVDIVLLLYQRGVSGNVRETILGIDIPPELVSKKVQLRERWKKLREKLKSGDEGKYKVAIIEAEDIIDDLLARMGYAGKSFGERLDNIPEGQIESVPQLRAAHETRNKIVHDESFRLSKEDAEATLDLYGEFLSYHEVL